MEIPFINIVIPTREHADSLFWTLQTCLDQEYPYYQILVSDNMSMDNTEEVVKKINDPRIKYVRTTRRLSMAHSWEFAVDHINDGYVIVLGDDDGLVKDSLTTLADVIKNTAAEAIRLPNVTYYWPNVLDKSKQGMLCNLPLGEGIKWNDSKILLNRVAESLEYYPPYFLELPSLYHGCISIEILKRIKARDGILFNTNCPDMYSAVMIAGEIDKFISLNFSICINGLSKNSNGISNSFSHIDNSEIKKFFSEEFIPFSTQLVPAGQSLTRLLSRPVLVADQFLKAKEKNPEIPSIDIKKLIQKSIESSKDWGSREQYESVIEESLTIARIHGYENFAYQILKNSQFVQAATNNQRQFLSFNKNTEILYLDTLNMGINNVFDVSSLIKKITTNKNIITFLKNTNHTPCSFKELLLLLQQENQFFNTKLSNDNVDSFFVRNSIVNSIISKLPEFQGTLLDLGCGEMPYKDLITSISKVNKYIGLDIEDPSYQKNNKPDLYWDGKKIPLEDNSVDCVMATEVFEHVPEPLNIFSEINRVLKKDGLLFFTVPYLWPLHDVPHDEYRYTPFSLERMLKSSGFGSIKLKALGGWNASLAQMIGLWLKRSDASQDFKNSLSTPLFQLYQGLIETDIIPERFSESQMITGLSGTAYKETEKNNSMKLESSGVTEPGNNNICLAIFTPFLGALSETFIKKHVDLLAPEKTVIITGNIQDNSDNLPVIKIPWTEGPAKYSAQTEETVYNFLREHKVTHILVEYGCQGTEIVEMNLRRMQLPIFIHFHGYDASQMLGTPEIVEYYKWMSRNVSKIITCSFSMAERLIKAGVPENSIVVNHYGINIQGDISNCVDNKNCKFVFVGRLVAKKAPLQLLEAFLLASKKASNISLDIIGDEGLYGQKSVLFPQMQNFIKENNLEHLVKLHGAQNQSYVKNILKSSSIYVQHSITDPQTGDQEGLPNSILEASSYGLPVISTVHSGIPEEVDNNITGFLVEENDTKAMAEKMVYLAERPSLRKHMGDAARIKVLSEFAIDDSIENLQDIIFSEKRLNVVKNDITSNKQGVSVIIPSYNRAKLIEQAVKSVQAQTVPVTEIVIVDDASTDNTFEIVNKLKAADSRIKYYRLEKNSGAQVARNTGIKNASSEWVSFLDSDDIWLPKRVENALKTAASGNADVVYSNYIRRETAGTEVLVNPPKFNGLVYNELLKGSFVTFPGLFVRTKCFHETGFLDESIKSWQEWDAALRLSKSYMFAYDNLPGFIWIWHDGDTISKDNKRELVGYLQVVLKYKNDILNLCGYPCLDYHLTNMLTKINALTPSEDLMYLKQQVQGLKTRMMEAAHHLEQPV